MSSSIFWEEDLRHIPATMEYDEYVIGGKHVTATVVVPDSLYHEASADRERARQILVEKLAEAIIEHKLCTITTEPDYITRGQRIYVRAYLAPDSQVKLLRVAKCPTPNYRP